MPFIRSLLNALSIHYNTPRKKKQVHNIAVVDLDGGEDSLPSVSHTVFMFYSLLSKGFEVEIIIQI